MKITKTAEAGAAETSDILVSVTPNDGQGIQVELTGKAVVLKQFGKQMESVIKKTAEDLGVEDVLIKAKDNGALDCTIRARVRCALERAI